MPTIKPSLNISVAKVFQKERGKLEYVVCLSFDNTPKIAITLKEWLFVGRLLMEAEENNLGTTIEKTGRKFFEEWIQKVILEKKTFEETARETSCKYMSVTIAELLDEKIVQLKKEEKLNLRYDDLFLQARWKSRKNL